MLFKIVADAEFEAEDIEDAFLVLAEHFNGLASDAFNDVESEKNRFLISGGSIEISPAEDANGRLD